MPVILDAKAVRKAAAFAEKLAALEEEFGYALNLPKVGVAIHAANKLATHPTQFWIVRTQPPSGNHGTIALAVADNQPVVYTPPDYTEPKQPERFDVGDAYMRHAG